VLEVIVEKKKKLLLGRRGCRGLGKGGLGKLQEVNEKSNAKD